MNMILLINEVFGLSMIEGIVTIIVSVITALVTMKINKNKIKEEIVEESRKQIEDLKKSIKAKDELNTSILEKTEKVRDETIKARDEINEMVKKVDLRIMKSKMTKEEWKEFNKNIRKGISNT